MARLRVPASPAKARQTNSAYAAVSKKTNDHPNSPDRQPKAQVAFDPPSPEQTEYSTAQLRAVKSLASIDRTSKQDVQGYIAGQYKAIEKVGHEHIDPTGTKTVFFLGQTQKEEDRYILDEDMQIELGVYVNQEEDADRPWLGVRDSLQKIATFPTETLANVEGSKDKLGAETKRHRRLMRVRSAPSLAQCIANAGVYSADPGTDSDSDSEDDDVDLSQKIQRAISSFTKQVEKLENEPGETITPPGNSGNRSLAFLIARAGDDRSSSHLSPSASLSLPSSPNGTTPEFACKPCYNPDFYDHSPCTTHNEGNWGSSADDALEVLRERFRVVHCTGGGNSFDCGEWLDAKLETACSMVHGPSLLRFTMNCYEDEKLEQANDINVITQADRPEATGRIRTSPSKDTLDTKSSIRNSVFSKCTSLTSMSSYRTSRPQSAQTEHPRITDGLDLDNETQRWKDDCNIGAPTLHGLAVTDEVRQPKLSQCSLDGTVQVENRETSLPVPTTKEWLSGLQVCETDRLLNAPGHIGHDIEDAQCSVTTDESEEHDVEDISQLPTSLPTATESPEHMFPEAIINQSHEAPLLQQGTPNFVDNVSTNSDLDSEFWSEPLNGCAVRSRVASGLAE